MIHFIRLYDSFYKFIRLEYIVSSTNYKDVVKSIMIKMTLKIFNTRLIGL